MRVWADDRNVVGHEGPGACEVGGNSMEERSPAIGWEGPKAEGSNSGLTMTEFRG